MPQPFPFTSQHPYPTTPPHQWVIPDGGRTSVADGNGIHAHRYNVFYEGQAAQVFVQSVGGCTYTVHAMLPAVYGSPAYGIGDTVTGGTVTGQTVTLGTVQPGHYDVKFDVADVDAAWGTSAGRCFVSSLRRHAGFPQVDTLGSTYNQTSLEWKPNGYGLTGTQVDANTGSRTTVDMVARAVCSMPMGRISIFGSVGANFPVVFDPDGGPSQRLTDAQAFFANAAGPYYLAPTTAAWVDPVRPRPAWVSFPVFFSTYDGFSVPDWASIYPLNPTIDATKIFLKLTAGSSSGAKLQVYYPNASTLVETYDNLADGAAASVAVNTAPSSHILCFVLGTGPYTTVPTPTAIGNTNRTAVADCVRALYPLGVTRFEGPYNEPSLRGAGPVEAAHLFWLFHAAVTDTGLPVKAMGPTPVSVADTTALGSLLGYLTATAGLTKDDFAFALHDYGDSENGDVNQGRNYIEAFLALLKSKGLDGIELWQTEANYSLGDMNPVFLPEKKKTGITKTLLWEQYGIPRERNPHWYDSSNGYWVKPWFFIDANNSLMGEAVLFSVLGQETFGQLHHHRIDFGSVPANRLFSGSVYGSPLTGSTAVMWCHSYMPNSTVTVKVAGTSSNITAVDCCGNTAPLTPDGDGLITVKVPEFPTYLRLPAGVTISVDHPRNWAKPLKPSVSRGRVTAVVAADSALVVADDAFKTGATSSERAFVQSTTNLPTTTELVWGGNLGPVEHLLVFCGPAVDDMPGLLQYSVQTYNGSTWTTQPVRLDDGTFGTTVTHAVPASVFHPDGASSTGTTRDQFWREQWIEDIEFQTPVANFQRFRLVVPAGGLSFGGAVDAAADALMFGYGRSSGTGPKVGIQEIMVLSAAAPAAAGLAAPVNVSPATMQTSAGITAVGEQLQAVHGSWTNNPTSYSYQWQRSRSPGGPWVSTGVTSSDYLVGDADSAYYLRPLETAANLAGSATLAGAAAGPVGFSTSTQSLVSRTFTRKPRPVAQTIPVPMAVEVNSVDCDAILTPGGVTVPTGRVFNIALGQAVAYYKLVQGDVTNTAAIGWLALDLTNIEADSVLIDRTTVSSLLTAGTTREASNGGYTRIYYRRNTLTAYTPDFVNNWGILTSTDLQFGSIAAGDSWRKIVCFYDPNPVSSSDTLRIPLTLDDFSAVPNGQGITGQVTGGWFKTIDLVSLQ